MARRPRKSGPLNGLTPIPQGIHCPATTEGVGENSELEQLQIDHFNQTLADIALAVAARKIASQGGQLECEP